MILCNFKFGTHTNKILCSNVRFAKLKRTSAITKKRLITAQIKLSNFQKCFNVTWRTRNVYSTKGWIQQEIFVNTKLITAHTVSNTIKNIKPDGRSEDN